MGPSGASGKPLAYLSTAQHAELGLGTPGEQFSPGKPSPSSAFGRHTLSPTGCRDLLRMPLSGEADEPGRTWRMDT